MEKFDQTQLEYEISEVVNKTIKKKVFSACCISFSRLNDNLRWENNYSYGYTEKNEQGVRVNKETFFDLASLTKPLVTTLSAAALIEEGKLRLEDKISDCCHWQLPENKKNIRISHLLSHSSGLPAHKNYYKKLHKIPTLNKKEKLKKWILNEKLLFSPGTDCIYSDLGFILLGLIIEEKSGYLLDLFWKEKIITPLKLQKGLFFTKNKKNNSKSYAATEKCIWDGHMLSGTVHDDNCRAMGGVGGHAGLFGTASAVLSLCEHIIKQFKNREKHPSYSCNLLGKLLTENNNLNWTYGFDIPTKENSSSGSFFSDNSRGHLGFTGTSFWIDFEKEISVVVLTNRVHSSPCIYEIKKFRPLIHNIIMSKIIKNPFKVLF